MSADRLVILRQPEDSADYEEAARERGFIPLVEPMLTIQHLDADYTHTGLATPLIFTSAHGVQAFCGRSQSRGNPVYTVGHNTADEARRQGFTQVETAAGTGDDLAALLARPENSFPEPPVYIRAVEISKDLKGILSVNGVNIDEIMAYRADAVEKLSISLLRGLDNREINAIAFYSARGAAIFAELIEQYGRVSRLKAVKALCISTHVLHSVSVLPFSGTLVAETPDRYGMIRLLDDLSVNKE